MTTIRDSRNFSVHEITYTKYLKEGNITALTEIFNQSEEMQIIPVSLYVDGLFFGAKQIEIEAGASGKLFFENIPLETERLHVQIDAEDILAVDNHSYCIIRQEKMQKVLLVSKSNRFLEKALALHPNVELYVSEETSAAAAMTSISMTARFRNSCPRTAAISSSPRNQIPFTICSWGLTPKLKA